jgi:hypothetical protein
MSMTWLKLHHDIIHDIKLRRFTPQEKWAWVIILVLASENSDRGRIEADDEDLADICEFNSTQDWLYFKDKLRAKGMIEQVPGSLKVTNWEKRQYSSPSDKPEATRERKRKQRAKQKPDPISEGMSHHEHVTSMSRACHEIDKIQSIDLDLDPEKSIKDLVLDSHTLSASAEIKNAESECDKKNAVDPWQDPEPPKTRPTPINQVTVNQIPTTSSAALDQGSAPRERESFSSIPERPAFGVTRRVSNLEKEPSQWVPRWRKGVGPNEWHEGFVDWMTVNMFSGAKRSRGDVVAYLRKREADPTGAARQDIEAKFDDYELSWAAKTGNPADDEWIELGKLVSHVMEKKNVA